MVLLFGCRGLFQFLCAPWVVQSYGFRVLVQLYARDSCPVTRFELDRHALHEAWSGPR